jgi:hypothetical protein
VNPKFVQKKRRRWRRRKRKWRKKGCSFFSEYRITETPESKRNLRLLKQCFLACIYLFPVLKLRV